MVAQQLSMMSGNKIREMMEVVDPQVFVDLKLVVDPQVVVGPLDISNLKS